MTKHRHHIIPKHAGGSNDPENLVVLSIEEHAEAHRKLFEQHGRWQDRKAWHYLSGIAPVENARLEAAREGQRLFYADPAKVEAASIKQRETKLKNGTTAPWNAGKTGCTAISENVKRQAKEGNFHCIGDYQRGRKFDDEHREKLKQRALARTPKTCQHCGKETSPAMFARWHGEKCKSR